MKEKNLVSLVSSALPLGKHFACSFPCSSFTYLAKEKIRVQTAPTVYPGKWRTYTEIKEDGEG